MNNTRKTVNLFLSNFVASAMPGWGFRTGDEDDPTIHPPAVVIRWLDGGSAGTMRSGGRMRLAQLELFASNQATSAIEAAADQLLDALGIRIGSKPIGVIPKLDLSAGRPGVPLHTEILVRLQMGKGWIALPAPQQDARLLAVTLELDYLPG